MTCESQAYTAKGNVYNANKTYPNVIFPAREDRSVALSALLEGRLTGLRIDHGDGVVDAGLCSLVAIMKLNCNPIILALQTETLLLPCMKLCAVLILDNPASQTSRTVTAPVVQVMYLSCQQRFCCEHQNQPGVCYSPIAVRLLLT